MRLEHKAALISGGARGMGAVEARLFAREGAKVVIGDVLEEDGRRVEAEINESGGECVFVHLDVTDETSWNDAVNQVVSRFGKLDILVNNAGIYRTHNVTDTSVEEWDQVMDINAKGVFLGAKAAIPEMRKAGGRLNHQYLIGGRTDRQPFLLGLHRFERGSAPFHQVHRRSIRPGRHPFQLGAPRDHRDANDGGDSLLPRLPPRPDRPHSAGPAGHTRGRCLRSAIPGVRRIVLRDRRRVGDRRRTHRRIGGGQPPRHSGESRKPRTPNPQGQPV